MNYLVYASLQLSENDRRAIIILVVILVLFFLLFGFIGMGLRKLMEIQGSRIETAMHDVTVTHIVNNAKDFRRLAFKKSNRILFQQSLIPVTIAFLAFLIWLIGNIATSNWKDNIFEQFGELFFHYDWVGTPEDPVFVKVFFLKLLARWPEVSASPTFIPVHIPAYLSVILFIISWVYLAVVSLGYLSRMISTLTLSHSIFKKSLEGFNSADDLKKEMSPSPQPQEEKKEQD